MRYLESFRLVSAIKEDGYILSFPYKLEMTCYNDNVYPFKIFPQKQLNDLSFDDVTIFCGGNGSGKSTILNIIAQKLKLVRSAPFNNAPHFEEYLDLCDFSVSPGRAIPKTSKIITSDDIFDYLLDIRSINSGIEGRRQKIFEEYQEYQKHYQLRSLDEYDELKRRNEAKNSTKSVYTARRLPKELTGKSNGESAYLYFTHQIEEDALYLLDEPENSLSAKQQSELVNFITDSVRFYRCQFIISTHSPFFLSIKGAKNYDLDSVPVSTKEWSELDNVQEYYRLFKARENEF